MGVEAFRKELEKRCGFELEDIQPYQFTARKDRYGWMQDYKGNWHYTLFVENGRVTDESPIALQKALLDIAETQKAVFRFTSNQNVIISDIQPQDKKDIEDILQQHGILLRDENISSIRKNAIACVALPTCPLALAEAQRYLPDLITNIEPLLIKHGLSSEDIVLRMTGCPNGCARPYAAEIGLVGTSPGHYNLHIGGDHEGTRLNVKFKEQLDEANILVELDQLFKQYADKRNKHERFGDFVLKEVLHVS